MRRLLRITPLYVLFLILVTLFHIFGQKITNWKPLLYTYTYIYNFVPRESYSTILGHTWSLAVEEHFYLIWPFIFFTCFNKKRGKLLLGISATIIFFMFINNFLHGSKLAESYFVGRWSFIAGINIAFGCIAALILCENPKTQNIEKITKSPMSLVSGFILYYNSLYMLNPPYRIDNYLRGIGVTLIIMWIYLNQNSRIISALEFKPLKYIGLISYGIYMFQGFCLGTGPYRAPGQTWPPNIYLGFVLLIITAPLSYHFFEKPFLKLKKKFSR